MSYGFAPSVSDILTEAWERCGLNPVILTAEHAQSARRSLQAMLIDWTNSGLNLWQIENDTTLINASERTVALPTGTVDVLEVVIMTFGVEIVMTPISRDEWAAIPNKKQLGRPVQYWTDRKIDNPVLNIWPSPDRAYSMSINRLRMPQDVTGLSQSPDAPVLWTEALYAGMAARMAEKYAPEREPAMVAKADRAFSRAAGENRERVPLSLLPRLW